MLRVRFARPNELLVILENIQASIQDRTGAVEEEGRSVRYKSQLESLLFAKVRGFYCSISREPFIFLRPFRCLGNTRSHSKPIAHAMQKMQL